VHSSEQVSPSLTHSLTHSLDDDDDGSQLVNKTKSGETLQELKDPQLEKVPRGAQDLRSALYSVLGYAFPDAPLALQLLQLALAILIDIDRDPVRACVRAFVRSCVQECSSRT